MGMMTDAAKGWCPPQLSATNIRDKVNAAARLCVSGEVLDSSARIRGTIKSKYSWVSLSANHIRTVK
jgi:hypothetical protein